MWCMVIRPMLSQGLCCRPLQAFLLSCCLLCGGALLARTLKGSLVKLLAIAQVCHGQDAAPPAYFFSSSATCRQQPAAPSQCLVVYCMTYIVFRCPCARVNRPSWELGGLTLESSLEGFVDLSYRGGRRHVHDGLGFSDSLRVKYTRGGGMSAPPSHGLPTPLHFWPC